MMRLKGVTINDFRRFTKLTVQDIPDTTRLIMLAGPNGCGKSSFFDALHSWHTWTSNKPRHWDGDYHEKVGSTPRHSWSRDLVDVEFHQTSLPKDKKKIFYVRSAYRNDPEFRIGQLQRVGNALDEVRVQRMIDNDAAVSRNYQWLAAEGLVDLYGRGSGSTTFEQYRHESIQDVQLSLKRLFPALALEGIANPLEDGTFRFTKGNSNKFPYKNLSGGEKAAFDLILDLAVARREYDNTIFCIDEPEAHMHTELQAKLLSILYDLIPGNCQLMLATHSLGMMRRAREIEARSPRTVTFLDFGDRNFDHEEVIKPATQNRAFWERAYGVALGDMAALVAPEQVVICEGEAYKGHRSVRNHSHDARCYNQIFEKEFPETKFVSMGNDREIIGDRWGLAETLQLVVGGLKVLRLIDRDCRENGDIEKYRHDGIRVLSWRNLESYLFADEVLKALAASLNKSDIVPSLLEKKRDIVDVTEFSGDLMNKQGEIYAMCVNVLKLPQSGNDADSFMRDTLARLIQPGTDVYERLKRDIFGM